MRSSDSPNRLWRRRDVIKTLGATALTLPAVFPGTTVKAATSKVIKIGHVSPKTGPLAPFAEADPFICIRLRRWTNPNTEKMSVE
jgi:branched-chain amino acid transport system substrate-binding protein